MTADQPRILGVYLGHDLGAALLVGGRLVCAIEEERLSRVKHGRPQGLADLWRQFDGAFGYFPWASVTYCLRAAGLTLDQLDGLYVGDYLWGQDGQAAMTKLIPMLDPSKVHFITQPTGAVHHYHHALGAFFGSSFERAAVLIVDGDGTRNRAGYEAETGYFFADRSGRSDVVFQNRYPDKVFPRDGIGWMYEQVSMLLGFYNNSIGIADPGKTMGLAGYGRAHARLAEPWLVRDGFKVHCDGFRQWLKDHDFDQMLSRVHRGQQRSPLANTQFGCDIAFKAQAELESAYVGLAQHLMKTTGAHALCLSGGVALNSVANGRLLQRVPSLFVQPAANDGGQAIGIAYHGHLLWSAEARERAVTPIRPLAHAYCGRSYSELEIDALLRSTELQLDHFESEADVARAAAESLVEGRIVGWHQRGSEMGPRALGHRSILADPRGADVKDRVNAKVKFRESFRPFAPAVLHDRVHDVFETDQPSPYMLLVANVREAWRDRVPAIVHVDGSARIQTVDPERSPIFHRLITAFHEATGVPVVLNTSFNLKGMPIVETPRDALECFLLTELNELFIGRYRVRAPRFSEISFWWSPRWKPTIVRGIARDALSVEAAGPASSVAVRCDERLAALLMKMTQDRPLAEVSAGIWDGTEVPRDAYAELLRLARAGALQVRTGSVLLPHKTLTPRLSQSR